MIFQGAWNFSELLEIFIRFGLRCVFATLFDLHASILESNLQEIYKESNFHNKSAKKQKTNNLTAVQVQVKSCS